MMRFAVARENPLYNYRDEAESWRDKCIDLHQRLDDLRRGYIPPLPEPQAKVITALRAEIKRLRRERQRLGRYAVENRQLKRQIRAANARAEGYQRQAEAALRVMEELKAKTK